MRPFPKSHGQQADTVFTAICFYGTPIATFHHSSLCHPCFWHLQKLIICSTLVLRSAIDHTPHVTVGFSQSNFPLAILVYSPPQILGLNCGHSLRMMMLAESARSCHHPFSLQGMRNLSSLFLFYLARLKFLDWTLDIGWHEACI
jgi:hypothetical protein